jgi:putative NIF3 family GTP cyclohydrolase 1 type 2
MLVKEVIGTIAREVPISSGASSVDNIKVGSDRADVRGIVCAFMPTVEVLREAARLGANLVIVHEPIFYNHTDDTSWLADDPVVAEKKSIAAKSGLTVFRFHDAPHAIGEDMIRDGVAAKLGWQAYHREPGSPYFDLPEQSLVELAGELRRGLGISRPMRLAGDHAMRCSRVALIPGFGDGRNHIRRLADSTVDALVVGEGHEWEACEYARDARAIGQSKGIIYLGHAYSEDAGMEAFAGWLRARLPDLQVTHVATESPFTFV